MTARWVHDRLVLTGEIDMDNAAELRTAVDAAIAAHPDELVVDARLLEFCDSTCLACILRALQARIPVRMVAASPPVRRALQMSGIDQHELLTLE